MRGESFEPGGCSACPTSAEAAATIAAPGPPAPPAGATGPSPAVEPGPMALESMPANDELPAAVAVVGAGAEGAVEGGASADWSAAMRATTVSMLTRVYSSGRGPTLRPSPARNSSQSPGPRSTRRGRPRDGQATIGYWRSESTPCEELFA